MIRLLLISLSLLLYLFRYLPAPTGHSTLMEVRQFTERPLEYRLALEVRSGGDENNESYQWWSSHVTGISHNERRGYDFISIFVARDTW
jgi:hypothetical protein